MQEKVSFTVNGKEYEVEVLSNERLLDTLRDNFGLTGTKEGCSIGECGACTVLLNGEAVNSCLIFTVQVQGGHILTVEGLEKDGKLSPLQEAFVKYNAVQCGYCSPGMLMAATAILKKNPQPSREEIKEGIAGVLCRCTGYEQIIQAIEAVAKKGEG